MVGGAGGLLAGAAIDVYAEDFAFLVGAAGVFGRGRAHDADDGYAEGDGDVACAGVVAD